MIITATYLDRPKSLMPLTCLYHFSFIHSLGKYVRKMASMSQKRLCWNNAVTMATPQIFFSQPFILYPRHITKSKKYGFALFYRGEGFTFFSPSWPLHYKVHLIYITVERTNYDAIVSQLLCMVTRSITDRVNA